MRINHYYYIERVGPFFDAILSKKIGSNISISDLGSAHGDKAYQYDSLFKRMGVTFEEGVLIYLLTYECPFSNQVRMVNGDWVDVRDWLTKTLQMSEIRETLKEAYDQYMEKLFADTVDKLVAIYNTTDELSQQHQMKELFSWIYKNGFQNAHDRPLSKAVYTNADYFLYGEINVVSIDEFQLFYDSETGQYGVYNGSYSLKAVIETLQERNK